MENGNSEQTNKNQLDHDKWREEQENLDNGKDMEQEECPDCNGTGQVIGEKGRTVKCPYCKGTGKNP